MPTDTARRSSHAANFVAWGVAGSLGLFGLLRLPWVEAHAVLPLTQLQGSVAETWFGTPAMPVQVTLACSGADALALCVAAVLAYPVRWRERLAGAAGGVAVILVLNTLRIATLGRAVAFPGWFNALHLYIWPAVLVLAIAVYVLAWMRLAERRASQVLTLPVAMASPPTWQPSRRFIIIAILWLSGFTVLAPLYAESAGVLALASAIAVGAATVLGLAGVDAAATANVLSTSRGMFIVTHECIATPLIPLYLAAVGAGAPTWRQWALWTAAAVPLFTALGVARLLVVAVPPFLIDSPLFFVHAFYQLLLAAVMVGGAAIWRHGRRRAFAHAAAGIAAGVSFLLLLGPIYSRGVAAIAVPPLDDPQGAIAFLPAFQIGLYLALWVAAFLSARWTHVVAGLGLLAATQVAGLAAIHALAAAGLAMEIRDVRAWAVAGPALIFAMAVHRVRTSR